MGGRRRRFPCLIRKEVIAECGELVDEAADTNQASPRPLMKTLDEAFLGVFLRPFCLEYEDEAPRPLEGLGCSARLDPLGGAFARLLTW